ncbi:MAG: MFS transporter, partial [Promethearchaeota archaeon]
VLFGAWEFFTPLFWTDVVGIPEPLTGPLLTLFTATVLVASPGLGALSDRWGRRGFITGGLTALCLLMIIQGFLLNPLIQAGLVMLIGLAMAATVTSSAPLITEVVEAQVKGTALGLLGTIMDVGQALGPICVGLLLAIGGGYTFAFLVVCGVLLLIPLLLLIGLDPTPSQS